MVLRRRLLTPQVLSGAFTCIEDPVGRGDLATKQNFALLLLNGLSLLPTSAFFKNIHLPPSWETLGPQGVF